MKTIGLIGGISWESTQEYYHLINSEINQRLGGKHSARIILYSFDFQEIYNRLEGEDFQGIGKRLLAEAMNLQRAGADLLVLCANTAHRWAPEVVKHISIPLVHIGDATGAAIRNAGVGRVLLLGTKYTMEGDFIKGILEKDYGVEVVVPGETDRIETSRIIFEELIVGKFNDSARDFFGDVISKHTDVEGVILGCTELPLIIKDEDSNLPLFNTTHLHAMAAVEAALK